jgi:DDB1- and CUL4-associated factor 11
MNDPRVPHEPLSEDDDPRTVFYDPTDPFWHDTEDDNDDMDYVPAPGDSEDDEEANFHGMWQLEHTKSKECGI